MFFIVGVGRSGTSLLQSILSSHSKICMPPETGFLRNACLGRSSTKNVSIEVMAESFPRLKRVSKKLSPEIQEKKLPNELALYRYILNSFKKHHGKEIGGDKDPKLVEYIPAVSKIFPDAKFIHLIRDPRDVLLSKKKAEWSKDKPAWYHIFANYVQLRLGEHARNKLPTGQYLVVTYEDMLNSPEDAVTEVCEFLEVRFEPSMLAFQEKAKELVSENELQWKKETTGPLLKNNSGKWKGKLKSREVALTECLCGQAFELGNYKTSKTFDSLKRVNKFSIKATSFFFEGVGSVYMLYVLIRQNLLVLWKK